MGGDWSNIVELPDGRIGIVVGDCVGHGLDAATVMGQLRSACRALLLQDASAAQTLTAIDRFAVLIPGAICSTVFCGILDRDAGRLTYSSAGHPPGILALPGGRTELLKDGRSFRLRCSRTSSGPRRAVPCRPGRRCCCTPTAWSSASSSMDTGIAEAGTAVHRGEASTVEDLATAIMTAMAPGRRL